ncbi:SPOR domain-containing protein [Maliponia aquimaris]|uniref:Sporulation related domain protein n=1 Tax=Maliponia aquimaris TaxID=1673631 RepID=A0A238KR87_9RHOB|nr:SPOR domain-containing protein [Maliponia aquimaris]SMX45295.1 Sporulation related domain protein [Maliponia aquimaris]
MADFTYEGAGQAPSPVRMATVANWTGAVLSLALVAGIGVWSYGIISRDVSGIPVVQAVSGPMRVAPEDPGGTLADHQGLAVNAVAGQGAAADPAERLVLAPVPAGLQADDVALSALKMMQPAAFDASLAENAEVAALVPEGDPVPESAEPALEGAFAALADEIAAASKPLTPLLPEAEDEITAALASVLADDAGEEPLAEPEPVRYSGPGLAQSLRPKMRPAGLSDGPRASARDVAPATQVTEIEPETLPTGTRLVQIGAFDSPDAARAEWVRLEQRFGEYLEGKDRVIQRATSGGRVFYRLRAHGFGDLSDARRFCAAFVAQNVDCIPVVTR